MKAVEEFLCTICLGELNLFRNEIEKTMKILYYSSLVNHSSGAGIHGTQFYYSAKKILADQSDEIKSFFPIGEKRATSFRFSKFGTLLTRIAPAFLLDLGVVIYGVIKTLRGVRRLENIRKSFHFDLVLMRINDLDWTCLTYCQRYGVPLILEVNAPISYEIAQMKVSTRYSIYRKFEQQMWNAADMIITVSETLKQFIVKNGIKERNVFVNPNGVDTEFFSPNQQKFDVRRKYHLEDKFVLLFSGSPMPWNDLKILMQVLPKLGDHTVLMIIGHSPFIDNLLALTKELAVTNQFIYVGRVDHDLVPSFLAAADVLVATYKQHDMFYFSPMKIIEYMSMGKPVIASSLGQNIELLNKDCGYLIPPENEEELVSAILEVQQNPTKATLYGKNARNKILDNYTWSANAKRVVEICNDLLNLKRSAKG